MNVNPISLNRMIASAKHVLDEARLMRETIQADDPHQLSRVCGCCGRVETVRLPASPDTEFTEFCYIEHDCGYGSIFEDGATMSLFLCQHCFKRLLGPYLTIEPSPY